MRPTQEELQAAAEAFDLIMVDPLEPGSDWPGDAIGLGAPDANGTHQLWLLTITEGRMLKRSIGRDLGPTATT